VYKTFKFSSLFTWAFLFFATLICCACLFFCYFCMSCSFMPCIATLLFPLCVAHSHLTLLFCCFHLALFVPMLLLFYFLPCVVALLLLPYIVHSCFVLFTPTLHCCCHLALLTTTLLCCSHLACYYLFPPCTVVVCLGCNHSSWVVII
jgi:hypothetical protein